MTAGDPGPAEALVSSDPLVAAWLKLRSEPFLWGIRRDRFPSFLESCGLGNAEALDEVRLREEILVPRGLGEIRLARGECLCLCSPIANDRDPVQ
jgi:hypothetical protein